MGDDALEAPGRDGACVALCPHVFQQRQRQARGPRRRDGLPLRHHDASDGARNDSFCGVSVLAGIHGHARKPGPQGPAFFEYELAGVAERMYEELGEPVPPGVLERLSKPKPESGGAVFNEETGGARSRGGREVGAERGGANTGGAGGGRATEQLITPQGKS